MQDKEKNMRCRATKTRYDAATDTLDCKVYARWVRQCDDCSFFTGRHDVFAQETRKDV